MKNWLSIRHTCEDQVRSFLWCEELVPIMYTFKSLTHATKKKQKKNWRVTCSSVSSEFVNDLPEIDHQILSWRFGHENISTAILPLQKEHLAVDDA